MRCLLLLLSISSVLFAAGSPQTIPVEIAIHNRVLAKINGKPISVIDLMKKMEVMFYREYPQYAEVTEAKFQFFSANWKNILNDLIDADLIMESAKELKLPISDGDVRQEIESIFGPNVVMNIDKLGMTYEEVCKMVQKDITVRRMTYAMAQMNAINRVGPNEVRKAYENYCKEHPIEEAWDYRVLSIKATHSLKGTALAQLCHKMLTEDKVELEKLPKLLEEKHLLGDEVSISLSEPMHRTTRMLSDAHKEGLANVAELSFSKPLAQTSRLNNKQTIMRIYYLEQHTDAGVVPLSEVEEKLRNQLLDKTLQEETGAYRAKLRKRFGIDEAYLQAMIPSDFEPFTLTLPGDAPLSTK